MAEVNYNHDRDTLDIYRLLYNSLCTRLNRSLLLDRTGMDCIHTQLKQNTTTRGENDDDLFHMCSEQANCTCKLKA